MGEEPFQNDPEVNAIALDMASRTYVGRTDDLVVDAAVKFRHFIMTGKVLIPPQPEQPA